ncbi:hypothetical protein [Flavobacterium sp.]|uniref:hypothetical protein n=1 Tax=Flavobacterium sp. TaxID=239 RepID=UPI0031DE993B
MKKFFKLLFIFFTILGCTNDNVDCTTPPEPLIFQFIDKDSGENLFSNGTFDSKQELIIIDLKTARHIQVSTLTSENAYSLSIGNIGWNSENISYGILFFNKNYIYFTLNVDAQRITEKCSYTKYNSVEIKNLEYQYDNNTGIYKIFIETKNKKELKI